MQLDEARVSTPALGNVWTSAGPKRTHLGDELLFEELMVLRIGVGDSGVTETHVDGR